LKFDAIGLSKAYGGLLQRQFLFLLFAIAAVAGSLFTIFSFLATSTASEAIGMILFVLVTGLLMVGYMLAFMALGFAAILFFVKYWARFTK
jgi:hypothetical protein